MLPIDMSYELSARLALVFASCKEEQDLGEVLEEEYCEFMPDPDEREARQGRMQADVLLRGVSRFEAAYSSACEKDPGAFLVESLPRALREVPEDRRDQVLSDLLSHLDRISQGGEDAGIDGAAERVSAPGVDEVWAALDKAYDALKARGVLRTECSPGKTGPVFRNIDQKNLDAVMAMTLYTMPAEENAMPADATIAMTGYLVCLTERMRILEEKRIIGEARKDQYRRRLWYAAAVLLLSTISFFISVPAFLAAAAAAFVFVRKWQPSVLDSIQTMAKAKGQRVEILNNLTKEDKEENEDQNNEERTEADLDQVMERNVEESNDDQEETDPLTSNTLFL